MGGFNFVPKFIETNKDFEISFFDDGNIKEVNFTLKDGRRLFLQFKDTFFITKNTIDSKKEIIVFCTGFEKLDIEDKRDSCHVWYPKNIFILQFDKNLKKIVMYKFTVGMIDRRTLNIEQNKKDSLEHLNYHYNYIQDINCKKILMTEKEVELDMKINGYIDYKKKFDYKKLVHIYLDQN